MGPCVLEIAIILKIKKPFLFYGKTFFCSHWIILSSFHLLPLTTRTYKSILSLVLLQCENVHHVKTKEPGRELLIIFRVSNQNTFKAYPVFFFVCFFCFKWKRISYLIMTFRANESRNQPGLSHIIWWLKNWTLIYCSDHHHHQFIFINWESKVAQSIFWSFYSFTQLI